MNITEVKFPEGAILDALRDAKNANLEIVKLGIPYQIQLELASMIDLGNSRYIRTKSSPKSVKSIFGVKVEDSDELTITTKIKYI